MKVAVTAASGRLGRLLLTQLSAAIGSENVIGVTRDPSQLDIPDIDIRQGDYNSLELMEKALSEIDTVVMISAPTKEGTDRITMHRNVIEASKNAGVKRIIFTSVFGSDIEQETWFWDTQKENRWTEEDVKTSGLDWIIARNGLYLELDLLNILRYKEKGVYSNSGEDGVAGYISIKEIAYALACLAKNSEVKNKVFTISGPLVSQPQIVEHTNELFGTEIKYVPISDDDTVKKLMEADHIRERGITVAQMLAGCFQMIRLGGFNIESDFEEATGRPCKSTHEMLIEIKDRLEL